MRYIALISILIFVLAGCESESPNYSEFVRITAVDSSHLGYDASVAVITIAPIRSDVSVRIDTLTTLHDSLIVFCYSHALVYDTARYFMRKPTYTLADTLHFFFEGVVDSLGEAPSDPSIPDQYYPDSLRISVPSIRTPEIVLLQK